MRGDLAVATWNVHSCVGIDGKFSPDRVAEGMLSLDADVIGAQEIGWHHRGEQGLDQFRFLARATGYRAIEGPTKRHARAHYGNALFTRLPVLAERRIDISLPGREPRGAIDVELDVAGRAVRVVSIHLGLGPAERNRQVEILIEALESGPRRPTILMGDLNEWYPRSPRLHRLQEHFAHWTAPRSFPARMPTLRLDRIFCSAELKLDHGMRIQNKATRLASDHLPVRARLAFVSAPETEEGAASRTEAPSAAR